MTLLESESDFREVVLAAFHELPPQQMYTNSFAAISALLNGLTAEIALRHSDDVADTVTSITDILEDDDGVLEG